MIRAYLYLGFAGVVWLIEGFLFSHYLQFEPWQVVLTGLIYVALYGIVVINFSRSLRAHQGDRESSAWRAVSLVPMLVVVVGSFASLPLIVAVAALGKVL
jgi:hypothetical protein